MKVKVKHNVHNHELDEFDNQNLEPNKTYVVIGIDCDYYRIVNEIGEPILYPKNLFEVIDPLIPESWIREEYGPDEYYINPPELSKSGFYEDLFNNDSEAMRIFEKYLLATEIIRNRHDKPLA